jgi:hypothetical protein
MALDYGTALLVLHAADTPCSSHTLVYCIRLLLDVGALPRGPVHFEPARDSRTADTIFSCRLTPDAGAQSQCPCTIAMIPTMVLRQAVLAGIPPITRPIFPPANLSTCFPNMQPCMYGQTVCHGTNEFRRIQSHRKSAANPPQNDTYCELKWHEYRSTRNRCCDIGDT